MTSVGVYIGAAHDYSARYSRLVRRILRHEANGAEVAALKLRQLLEDGVLWRTILLHVSRAWRLTVRVEELVEILHDFVVSAQANIVDDTDNFADRQQGQRYNQVTGAHSAEILRGRLLRFLSNVHE